MKRAPYNKTLNTVFICIGGAVFLFIVIMLTYHLLFKDEGFRMTKQEFALITDDDELYEKAYEWADNFCPISYGSKKFNSASQPVKNALAMFHLDAEVLNGGFPQFYYNGYDGYGFDYIGAFNAAGLDYIAELVEEADKRFAAIKSTMPNKDGGLTAFSNWYENNPLNELDDIYAENQVEVWEKIVQYIRENIIFFGD